MKGKIKAWIQTIKRWAFQLVVGGNITFCRVSLRKPFFVFAVIVDHVILLNPFHLPLFTVIKRLPVPVIVAGIGLGRPRIARSWGTPIRNTSITVIEILIGSSEGSFGPICLDKSTSCCPVVGIPKARVYFHGLISWEWDSNWLQVLEFPNGNAIDVETKIQKIHPRRTVNKQFEQLKINNPGLRY